MILANKKGGVPESQGGLGAAIRKMTQEKSSELDLVSGQAFKDVDLDLIEVNPDNTRKEIDEETLSELAASVADVGVIQPIVLMPHPDKDTRKKYMIVAGERRYRASIIAGKKSIPAVIRTDLGPLQVSIVNVIENLQREDVNPFDLARRLQAMMKEFNLKRTGLADLLGKPKSTISDALYPLNATGIVYDLFSGNEIPASTAVILTRAQKVNAELVNDKVQKLFDKNEEVTFSIANQILKEVKAANDPKPDPSLTNSDGTEEIDESANNTTVPNEVTNNSASDEEETQDNVVGDTDCLGGVNDDSDELGDDRAEDGNGQVEQFDNVDTNNVDSSSDVDLSSVTESFVKRSASKAVVSVKVEGLGHGTIALHLKPKEPHKLMVEFASGETLAVDIIKCQLVGYE